jgi:hypothetical protein
MNGLICLMLLINLVQIIKEFAKLFQYTVVKYSRLHCDLLCNKKSKKCPDICFKIKEWFQANRLTNRDIIVLEIRLAIIKRMS